MSDRIKTFKIFCGNLSGDVTNEDLHYLFSQYGPVMEAVVMKGKFYGFVHMEHEGDGWRAICNLRGHKLKGKAMAVEPSINSKRVNPIPKQNIIGQGISSLDDFDDFELSMEHIEGYVEEHKRDISPIPKNNEILPYSEPSSFKKNISNTILPPPGLGSPSHFFNNSDSSLNHSSLNPSLNSGSSTSSPLPDNSLTRAIEEDLLLSRKSPQLPIHRQSPLSLQSHQKFPLYTTVDANSNSISSSHISSKKDWSLCSLCETAFDDWQHKPKILSCGHTFCCDCLISLASAIEVKCPSGCPYTTSLTEAGISGLTTNYTVPFKKSEELRSTPSPIMPPAFCQQNGVIGSSSNCSEVCMTCLKCPPLVSCSTMGHQTISEIEAWELLGGQMRELQELTLQQLRTAMTMRAAMKDRLQSTLASVEKFGQELRRKVEGEEMEEIILQEQLADLTQANEVLREPRGSIQSLLDNFRTVHSYSSIIPTTYGQCHAITAINNATEAINITLKPSSLNTLAALGFSSEEAFAMTSSLEQHAMCGNNANVVLLYMLSDLLASRMIQLTSIGATAIPSISPGLSSKPPPPPGLLQMSPRHIVDTSIIAHNNHSQSSTTDLSLNLENIFKVTEAIETGIDLPPIGSPDLMSGFNSCADSNGTPTITSFMSLGLSNLKILASDENEEFEVEKTSEKASLSTTPSSSFAEAAKKPAKPTPKIIVANVIKPAAPFLKSGKLPHCWMSISINGVVVGKIIFELRPDKAPKMCENFLGLCTSKPGYGYKGCHFFKSGDGILAGGDVENDDGTGGYSIYDAKPFEADLCPLKDEVGMVRFKGAGTSDTGRGMVGSQFMIWCTDREFKKFAFSLVFGKVIDGLEVAKKASSVNVNRASVIIEDCGAV